MYLSCVQVHIRTRSVIYKVYLTPRVTRARGAPAIQSMYSSIISSISHTHIYTLYTYQQREAQNMHWMDFKHAPAGPVRFSPIIIITADMTTTSFHSTRRETHDHRIVTHTHIVYALSNNGDRRIIAIHELSHLAHCIIHHTYIYVGIDTLSVTLSRYPEREKEREREESKLCYRKERKKKKKKKSASRVYERKRETCSNI